MHKFSYFYIVKQTAMYAKITLFFVFFMCAFQLSEAQKWCPAGATWYVAEFNYPGSIGFMQSQYSKDTIIAGQNCKEITDTGYSYNTINPGVPIFTYSSGDTVYFFNQGVFNSTFYFNCRVGDTLRVQNEGLGVVATIVDSVGIAVINNDTLRYYTFLVPNSALNCLSNDSGYINGGKVIERLGYVSFGPMGSNFSFGWDCSDWMGYADLHCYQDDSFGLYSTDSTTSCEQISTGITDVNVPVQIQLSPNPTTSYCQLQLSDESGTFAADIYDVTGRKVMPLFGQQHIREFNFNTATLPSGLYFVEVTDETGRTFVVKLVKG